MNENITRDWKTSTAYYLIYFLLYAILSKIGIKSEIHDSKIEFETRFLKEYYNEKEITFIKNSLRARIETQHYIDKKIPDK